MPAPVNGSAGDPSPPDEANLLARLARCAADLYRTVPLEGAGVAGQAEELAHAAELDRLAAALDTGTEAEPGSALEPRDVRNVCRLLIDVRRHPRTLDPHEVAVARRHFPEVEAATLAPLERLLTYYTGLLRG